MTKDPLRERNRWKTPLFALIILLINRGGVAQDGGGTRRHKLLTTIELSLESA